MQSKWIRPIVASGCLGLAVSLAAAQAQPKPAPLPPAQPAQPAQPGGPAQPGQQPGQQPGNNDPRLKALNQFFPNAQVQFTGEQTINGVRVYNATLNGPRGQANAQVTEHGDIIGSSSPVRAENLPHPVAQLLKELFKQPPQDVQVFNVTRYLADIRVNNKPVRLVVDAAGQIVDIRDAQQIAEEDKLDYPEAAGEQRRAIEPVAGRNWPDAKVQKVMRMPDAANFFVVDVRTRQNRQAKLVMNGANDIVIARVQIDPNELPETVVRNINQAFNTDNIRQAFRHDGEFYRITVPTNGGQVILQAKPTGEIMSVQNTQVQATERAITAGHREGGAQGQLQPQPLPPRDNRDNRDRDNRDNRDNRDRDNRDNRDNRDRDNRDNRISRPPQGPAQNPMPVPPAPAPRD